MQMRTGGQRTASEIYNSGFPHLLICIFSRTYKSQNKDFPGPQFVVKITAIAFMIIYLFKKKSAYNLVSISEEFSGLFAGLEIYVFHFRFSRCVGIL